MIIPPGVLVSYPRDLNEKLEALQQSAPLQVVADLVPKACEFDKRSTATSVTSEYQFWKSKAEEVWETMTSSVLRSPSGHSKVE